jgi:predicted O-methyltransferase YrrM
MMLRRIESFSTSWDSEREIVQLEIGTYLGVTSDFFLALLPESRVASIAYRNPMGKLLGNLFNNSELTRRQIGSEVQGDWKNRFTQLFGDSHRMDPAELVKNHGGFDLVFVDGDHANPKPKYLDVRRFLEEDLSLPTVATQDDYEGGIACWSKAIVGKLSLVWR